MRGPWRCSMRRVAWAPHWPRSWGSRASRSGSRPGTSRSLQPSSRNPPALLSCGAKRVLPDASGPHRGPSMPNPKPARNPHITGPRIEPAPIRAAVTAADLIDHSFLAYNAARLREGAQLLVQRMLEPDVTVGLSVTGALTPAGLGMSALIPLVRAGFVDWMVSTGANLYHDMHFGLGFTMHRGTHQVDDVELREKGVVRIYDIFFDYRVLLDTDTFIYETIASPEFQRDMSTAEFHYLLGKYVHAREKTLGIKGHSLLSV